ncbi:hypothetical protein DRQ25_07520 [Candidatus Fermentibacteria bacterium]|nr:MAG: hypothetical protein DRQ25_07520 [Candidatus Fermentibacteria bacterium]
MNLKCREVPAITNRMHNSRISILLKTILFTICLLLFSCGDESTSPGEGYEVIPAQSPQPSGERLFGIGITESEDGFASSWGTAMQVGTEIVELNIPWDSIEVSEGVYQDPMGGVFEAIGFFGYNDIEVMLSLAVVNTVHSTVPDYLQNSDWDSPEMIEAFNNLVDWVLSEIPSNVTIISISIGNETDLYLSDDAWEDYIQFVAATSDYIRLSYPGIVLGVKNTVTNGVLGGDLSHVQQVNQYTDVVMLTYYPQSSTFQVLDPEIVHSHLLQIVSSFPGREIWLNEVGYQSGSEHCGSTQTKQAQFYHEFFTAWDTNRQNIKLVLIDWLHDISSEQLAEMEEYYGVSDPGFLEYLATLGLLYHDGTAKYAWLQLLEETQARGW